MEKYSISPKLENVIVEHLLDMGIRWETITQQTGIYPEEIQSEDSRISPETHYKLLTMLHRECGVDWFLSGEGFDVDYFLNKNNVLDSFCEPSYSYAVLCLNSKSLEQAIHNYIHFRSVIGNVDRLEYHTDGKGNSEFGYFHYFPELNYSFVTLVNFIFIVFIVNHYAGHENTRFYVTCSNQRNALLENLYHYWNCDVTWEQKSDTIKFSCDNLSNDYPHYNNAVYQLTLNRIEDEYDKVQDVGSIRSIIETILKEMINEPDVEFKSRIALDKICDTLHLSKNTLARKLRNQNTTYKFIERKIKLDEAIRMLKDTENSIGEISYNLGFSSQSAFNRFFSDLMNITPLKFRKKNTNHY